MHLAITLVITLIVWKWADWGNWKKYHTTMLYVAMVNLLYHFFYHHHYLWHMKTSLMPTYAVELIYIFIVFPLTALAYLSNYPDSVIGRILHNLKYISIYCIVEIIFLKVGKIDHDYGWNMWWSLAWNCVMFPLWALHHKRPLIAYGASVVFVSLVLVIFPVG